MGVILFAVAFCAAIVTVVAAGLVAAGDVIAHDGAREALLGFAEDGSGAQRALTAAVSAVVGLGALALLFRRGGPGGGAAAESAGRAHQHVLLADDDGMVMVSTAGVAAVAETAAIRSHGVVEARVRVRGRGSAPIRVHVAADAYPGADFKRAGREVRENVKSSLQRLVGIEVTDVTVEMEVSENGGRGVA